MAKKFFIHLLVGLENKFSHVYNNLKNYFSHFSGWNFTEESVNLISDFLFKSLRSARLFFKQK